MISMVDFEIDMLTVKESPMRSLAVVKPNELALVDVPKPKIGPYDALIRTEVCFICNATDRKLIEGHFPGIGLDQYPMLLGHENAGIVEEKGDKVTTFAIGDRVIGGLIFDSPSPDYKLGWGGFSDYVVARDHQAMVKDGVADAAHGWDELHQIMKKVPAEVGPAPAGLMCTWREVFAGFTDFNLKPEYRILVFGAGPVGLSFIKFAKLRGFPFIASVEPMKEKHDIARKFGADAVYTPDMDFVAAFEKDSGGKADAIVDAVGSPKIINSALPLVKMAGSICVYGVIADDAITVEKHRGPYNFNLLVHQWPTREYEAGAHEPLCDLVARGKLDADDFITGTFPVEDYAKAFAASRQPGAIKTMITF